MGSSTHAANNDDDGDVSDNDSPSRAIAASSLSTSSSSKKRASDNSNASTTQTDSTPSSIKAAASPSASSPTHPHPPAQSGHGRGNGASKSMGPSPSLSPRQSLPSSTEGHQQQQQQQQQQPQKKKPQQGKPAHQPRQSPGGESQSQKEQSKLSASSGTQGSKKKQASKKDRSKLRKGKWTVEEEEYTSKILHYVRIGLLTLPEGSTPRSYLAEKLNCDPMRITKKFTGACCLGRRVYHLRERPQVTQAEIDMARADLERLEHRFRMRIEHDQNGTPLSSRRQDLLLAQPSALGNLYPAVNNLQTAATASWLKKLATVQSTAALAAAGQIPSQNAVAPAPMNIAASTWNLNRIQNQWLVPTAANTRNPTQAAAAVAAAAAAAATLPTSNQPNGHAHAINNAVTSLAWAQAAASLGPALNQLAAANIQQQQQQLRLAYEEHIKATGASQPAVSASASAPSSAPTPSARPQPVAVADRQTSKPVLAQPPSSAASHANRPQSLPPTAPSAGPSPAPPAAASAAGVMANMMVNVSSASTPAPAVAPIPPPIPAVPKLSPSEQLQQSYQAHLKSIGKFPNEKPQSSTAPILPSATTRASSVPVSIPPPAAPPPTPTSVAPPASNFAAAVTVTVTAAPAKPSARTQKSHVDAAEQRSEKRKVSDAQAPRKQARTSKITEGTNIKPTSPDSHEAGILLDFLNSLRSNYDDAIDQNGSKLRKGYPGAGGINGSASSNLNRSSTGVKITDLRDTKLPVDNSRTLSQNLSSLAAGRSSHAVSITDTSAQSRSETSSGTSSQPNESSTSSMDETDSKSDKSDGDKAATSSEEERDIVVESTTNKGPPRKRYKRKRPRLKQRPDSDNDDDGGSPNGQGSRGGIRMPTR